MPILFRKIRKRKPTKASLAKECSNVSKFNGQKPQNHIPADLFWCPQTDTVHTPLTQFTTDDCKETTIKQKSKTLGKIKEIFRKGKQKLGKERKNVDKLCSDNQISVDKTILVLKDLLKVPRENVNQSAIGNALLTRAPHLRSKSCTMLSEITGNDDTASYQINKCIPDLQKYNKYIPVRKIWGPLYPRSFVEDFKMVWLDMQVWYSTYYDKKLKENTNDDLNSSKSEGCLTESPSKNTSSVSDTSGTYETDTDTVNHKREERQRQALLKQRFRLRGNAEYISMVSWQRFYTPLDCRLQLYVNTSVVDDLVHLKTEMLVTCIRGFVLADGDFEVLWVSDIKKVLPIHLDVTASGNISPEVSLELASQLKRAKAVLYVSRAASILLRHHGICFLDTLAVTAGVERDELVVLPCILNPSEVKSNSSCVPTKETTPRELPPDPLF